LSRGVGIRQKAPPYLQLIVELRIEFYAPLVRHYIEQSSLNGVRGCGLTPLSGVRTTIRGKRELLFGGGLWVVVQKRRSAIGTDLRIRS
jgi:hypothetical protein